jgi:hypothetical protein
MKGRELPVRRIASALARCASLIPFLGVPGMVCAHEHSCDAQHAGETIRKLVDFAFDKRVHTRAITRAFRYKEDGYRFENLDEIGEYNSRSQDAIEGTERQVLLPDAPLESAYWWEAQSQSRASESFIHGIADILREESRNPECARGPVWSSVLEKALAQRDLVQIHGLVSVVHVALGDRESGELASDVESSLASLIKHALLSETEYRQLRALLPRSIPRTFAREPSYTLSENYLPKRLLANDPAWLEISGRGTPFRHVVNYRGRSFVKVYVRAPGVEATRLAALWSELYGKYGSKLHTSVVTEEPPPRLETMLVRTFGVYLNDGRYRDSFWPEEVILRMIRRPQPTVDLASSDFRGTFFYQYRMSRGEALRDPSSLGLRRTLDDDPQFFGFFGDVPDRRTSYSNTLTTMRSNCTGCHSELFYGLATIFSFERDPDAIQGSAPTSKQVLHEVAPGDYELMTPEARSLRGLLGFSR